MICEECKEDKMLHSEDIPLCEECYEGMFTIKSEVALTKRINEQPSNILLVTKDGSNTHTFKFTANGELYLNDRLLGTDVEVVEGLRKFLKLSGSL